MLRFEDNEAVTNYDCSLPKVNICSRGIDVFQAVLHVFQSVLVESCVHELFSVLERPLPTNLDQRLDIPHTHALNILKALFREAGLAGTMAMWTGRGAVWSIRLMGSPQWAIRNSATQLFSEFLILIN